MTQRSRLASSDRGAAAVEFALVALLLLTLVFGIIMYSLYFWQMQSGEAAAREVARHAAVGSTDCDALYTIATRTVSPLVEDADISLQVVDPDPAGWKTGTTATVTVTFPPFDLGFPFVPIPGGDLQPTAEFRVEHVVSGINSADCLKPSP